MIRRGAETADEPAAATTSVHNSTKQHRNDYKNISKAANGKNVQPLQMLADQSDSRIELPSYNIPSVDR
jgi:hypothetical protein